ncbi:Uncharacterised protein [Klebsiella pneumoniae]|nr:Uncharacterised protein [Klebsiella pneumoniae]
MGRNDLLIRTFLSNTVLWELSWVNARIDAVCVLRCCDLYYSCFIYCHWYSTGNYTELNIFKTCFFKANREYIIYCNISYECIKCNTS